VKEGERAGPFRDLLQAQQQARKGRRITESIQRSSAISLNYHSRLFAVAAVVVLATFREPQRLNYMAAVIYLTVSFFFFFFLSFLHHQRSEQAAAST